ncbi:hypothetical protein N9B21_01800 [Verrucomicrobiales bacterium]|nr:hypothetical protein [Verrucomicrobiales bacterium]
MHIGTSVLPCLRGCNRESGSIRLVVWFFHESTEQVAPINLFEILRFPVRRLPESLDSRWLVVHSILWVGFQSASHASTERKLLFQGVLIGASVLPGLRGCKNELVTSIWRNEDVSLWDDIGTFSNDIMKIIGTHLSLPHELFEVSQKWDPAVFVELEMSCNDRKVDSFSIKYSEFDIPTSIEEFGLSISYEEVLDIINKGDTPGLADAIKDYVLGILDADDEEATGFDLTLSEFNIQHLHIYSSDQISLKDWLSEREDIKVASLA